MRREDGREGDQEGGGASGRGFCCPDTLAHGRLKRDQDELRGVLDPDQR
jgi:hypothetical protein